MGRIKDLLIEQELADNGIVYGSNVVKCSHYGKNYRQETESQIPGFRDRDYDICPYCHETNGSSMEVEYHNCKIN